MRFTYSFVVMVALSLPVDAIHHPDGNVQVQQGTGGGEIAFLNHVNTGDSGEDHDPDHDAIRYANPGYEDHDADKYDDENPGYEEHADEETHFEPSKTSGWFENAMHMMTSGASKPMSLWDILKKVLTMGAD